MSIAEGIEDRRLHSMPALRATRSGPVVVCGMHRSGTSLVAEALSRCGVHLGDEFLPPGPFNPRGYFEDRRVVELHDEILSANETAWHDWRGLSAERCSVPIQLRRRAEALIESLRHPTSPWGWKDPRTSLFLDFWWGLLPQARFVFVYRDPAAVADSLLRRGDLRRYSGRTVRQTLIALRLWCVYSQRIHRFIERYPQASFLVKVPDDVTTAADVEDLMARLAGRWGLDLEAAAADRVYQSGLLVAPRRWVRALTRFGRTAELQRRLDSLRAAGLASLVAAPAQPEFGARPGRPARVSNRPATRFPIAIACPSRHAYSETFIRAHIERLPAPVRVLHGSALPLWANDHGALLPAWQRELVRLVAAAAGQDRERLEAGLLVRLPRRLRERAIREYLRRTGIRAVLAEYGPTGVALMDVCHESRIPLVVHFHGYDAYTQEILEDVGRRYRELFDMAASVVVVSRDMERQLEALGAPPGKVHYNPCGVDTTFFSHARPDRNPPHFVAVGRFVEKKGPHLTLLAFAEARQSVPGVRLTMIGEGPLLGACRQLAGALGIADAVRFPGQLAPPRVAAAFRGARAFVQHSLRAPNGDAEGTPVAVLEAGSSGLAVVASAHAGIVDVVRHGETGLLVDEGDVAGMAEALAELARCPARAAELGAAARARVQEEFSLERSLSRLWEILERSIEAAGSANGSGAP